MKSKIKWQCAALITLSLFFIGCKKEIKENEADKLLQENGTSSPQGIMCIANSIQFFKTESLLQARAETESIGLANKVLFIGGVKKNTDFLSERIDIYNTSTDSWTSSSLAERKFYPALAATGTKIGIAGGENPYQDANSDRVDIYDVSTDSWTVSQLSSQRQGVAGVGYGDYLYFAGGSTDYFGGATGGVTKTIDVYSTSTGVWSKLKLSQARSYLSAAATNNKIVFAGGEGNSGATDLADIYDVTTGTWSTGHLSRPRANMAAVALGNLIIFAGGTGEYEYPDFNDIDVYNTTTGFWSIAQISNASYGRIEAAAQGTKMFFGGNGNSSGPSVINVYDVCANYWSTISLTDGRSEFGIGAAGGKVLFGGGHIGNNNKISGTVDIFNLGTLIAQ